jgi:signal transduction histidine kinase
LPFRPKLFLTFSILCITPLLVLSLLSFRNGLKSTEALIRSDLNGKLADTSWGFQSLLRERQRELRALARAPIRSYVLSLKSPQADASKSSAEGTLLRSAGMADEARMALSELAFDQGYYARVAGFGPDKRQMFLAEPSTNETSGVRFRTRDFLPGQVQPQESVWTSREDEVICSVVSHPSFGEVLRCSTPVHTKDETAYLRGALVADVKLDSLMAAVVGAREVSSATDKGPSSRLTVVLDSSGTIVYHPNDAHKHQPIGIAMPYFAPAAASMIRGETGSAFYNSIEGDRWIEAHIPLKPFGLSLAVARNYSLATQTQRRAGWLGVALAILFGLGGASLLTAYFQKKTARIERVTERVASIASGNLEQRVDAPSRDDLRPIADSVNAMTAQLREQIAREAEAHQFQSFIKLSALLTHDLKNAIEALSLTVSNMERHFDKPEFRADTMKGLTSATDKLRALVARLSNPVNTMSGEFKMPRPTDLVPLLERVLRQRAEPLSGTYEIDARLPPSLFALADAERIEKVMENLVLNSIEAMSGNGGKLTVVAGAAEAGKVFFSVIDTGVGMSLEFIQQRLFRPFATTKKRGVGLGLYTCREVIRANGGTIEVDSTEGSGTTFRVVLASADNARMKTEG